jgi:hypothetical protein
VNPSPSNQHNIFLKDKKIGGSISGLTHLNMNQLSKKDINQFLRSALCSSRYSSTSANTANFNNLFKQLSVDGADITATVITGTNAAKKKAKVKS